MKDSVRLNEDGITVTYQGTTYELNFDDAELLASESFEWGVEETCYEWTIMENGIKRIGIGCCNRANIGESIETCIVHLENGEKDYLDEDHITPTDLSDQITNSIKEVSKALDCLEKYGELSVKAKELIKKLNDINTQATNIALDLKKEIGGK